MLIGYVGECIYLWCFCFYMHSHPRRRHRRNPPTSFSRQYREELALNLDALTFSADGERVAYIARANESNNFYRMLNNQVIDQVPRNINGESDIVFSPDGRRLAYRVEVDNQEAIVLDGKRGPLF